MDGKIVLGGNNDEGEAVNVFDNERDNFVEATVLVFVVGEDDKVVNEDNGCKE